MPVKTLVLARALIPWSGLLQLFKLPVQDSDVRLLFSSDEMSLVTVQMKIFTRRHLKPIRSKWKVRVVYHLSPDLSVSES